MIETDENKKTSILFLIFNRYQTSIQVFDSIREYKPEKLYIAADGPREEISNDIKKCEEARKIISMVDWGCEVFTLCQERNLGPMVSQMTAINWFFQNESEGIILEDDTVPDETFYLFCNELLGKYRDDSRVSMITGCNYQKGLKKGDSSYYFSKFTNTIGWATWKRSWDEVDIDLKHLPELMSIGVMDDFSTDKVVNSTFKDVFMKIHNNPTLRGWDYRFMFSSLQGNSLTIVPNVNLITNIGFGPDATNCFNENSPQAMLKTSKIELPLKHPSVIARNFFADEFEIKELYHKRTFLEKLTYYSVNWNKLHKKLIEKWISRGGGLGK
jgi:hypothetical protein